MLGPCETDVKILHPCLFYIILCWWLAFVCPQHVAVFPWFSPGNDFKTGYTHLNQTCPTQINEHYRFG